MDHYRSILARLPPQFSTVWLGEHPQLAGRRELGGRTRPDSPADSQASYTRLEGARCEPRPEIPIPIMVGTNGPKALGVTARQADWWNWDGPWEEVYRKPWEILRNHCEEIGRPFEE